MRESAIEAKVVRWAKAYGVESVKMTPMFSTGWPDRIFFIPGGRPLLIEFKRRGGKPTPLQEHRIKLLKLLHYSVEVCDDADNAMGCIARALAAARVPEDGR